LEEEILAAWDDITEEKQMDYATITKQLYITLATGIFFTINVSQMEAIDTFYRASNKFYYMQCQTLMKQP